MDTYHTLLEEEESRLNLNLDKPKRVFSRKRRCSEEIPQQAKVTHVDPIFKSYSNDPETIEMTSQTADTIVDNQGFLHISNVDSDGRYILIKNNSDTTENLCGYKIKHSSVQECQIFKFKPSSRLQPGKTVRIWANCLNARNSPPTDIVWRSQYKWITGRVTKTLILNPKGEKVAVFTQRTKYVHPPSQLVTPQSSQKQTPVVPDPVVVQDPPEQLREACNIM